MTKSYLYQAVGDSEVSDEIAAYKEIAKRHSVGLSDVIQMRNAIELGRIHEHLTVANASWKDLRVNTFMREIADSLEAISAK